MKNLKHISLLLFIAFALFSCSNNNDEPAAIPTLAGQWKLVTVTGGFVGVNDNFPAGQITWNIDTAANSVTVVNNNVNPNLQDILESGLYSYTLAPDPNSICTNTFNVNNLDLGCYTVSDTELIITYEYADGMRLRLIR
jgi:hypothetical protein